MNFPVQFLYSDILQHAMTKRTLKIEKINKNKKKTISDGVASLSRPCDNLPTNPRCLCKS